MSILWLRIIEAFSTLPTGGEWWWTVGSSILFGAIALPLGFWGKLLRPTWQRRPAATVISALLTSMIAPALLEELAYRVLLIPHPTEPVSPAVRWVWIVTSLVVYIAAHPLNALTLYRRAYPTFCSPIFLLLTALLGILCTGLYWGTGSIYPPAVVHGLVVFTWLTYFGGNLVLGYEVDAGRSHPE
jgi:predicted Abi (CAAX) family protease